MVRDGYKQTEIGVIPDDWSTEKIKDIAFITTGSRNTQDKVIDGKYSFFVRSQQIERINSYAYDGEGVLTAGDGVGTGKVYHYINGKFDFHQRVYLMYNFKQSILGYYFYLIFKNFFYNRVMQFTAKSSVDSVRKEMISDMLIPIPPSITEQINIATALGDIDKLIVSLEKLLEKKKGIKQGAMQKLLMPKEGWMSNKLCKLFNICAAGDLQKNKFSLEQIDEYIYPIFSNSLEKKGLYGYTSEYRYNENSITITGRGSLGHAEYRDCKFDAIVRLLILSPKTELDCYFISELINHTKPFVFESTGVPQLTTKQIENVELWLPSVDEQKSIAKTLSDMDNEIIQIEKRIAKARNIKVGMMQQLLTGTIRLL